MDRIMRPGFTKIELAIVVAILAFVLLIGIPLVQSTREESRRVQCLNNVKQISLAFQSHDSTQRRFPPSCDVTRKPDGTIVAMDGWSWCVHILPWMEYLPLWRSLDAADGVPLVEPPGTGAPHAAALAYTAREFRCPTFNGNPFVSMKTQAEAITNYKALGATHLESLNVASPTPTVPRYGAVKQHPDGGMFPGSTHGIDGFARDGTAHTALIAETVEQNVARWTVGNETCMVGLPPVVTFQEADEQCEHARPSGYSRLNFWDKSTIPAAVNRTYLDWDYAKSPYSDGGVSTPSAAASGPMQYGPSSHHPGIINHGFADGSVYSIANSIDAAAYMFLLTRNGREPNAPLD